jgi:single-strand DNA-binding protein
MALDNTVTVVGNCTRDPELRFTPSGQAVANFGLAVNRRWQNRQTQEWEEAVSFFDVSCWQQLAENVAESVQKGTRIVVTGRLDQRSWETQDGDKRSKIEIVADEVAPSLRWATADITKNERRGDFAGGGNSNSGGGGGGGSRAASNDPGPQYADEEPF